MSHIYPLLAQGRNTPWLTRAYVTAFEGTTATVETSSGEALVCDLLYTSSSPLDLQVGDMVLVHVSDSEEDRSLILGRIGIAPTATSQSGEDQQTPDEHVIEARKSLTLRVGDGSITIREDGRILIKGKDLVSHAKRMNRIKGGSVAIN